MGDFTASGDRETRSVTMAPQDPLEVAPMSRSAVLTKSDAGLGLSGRSAGSSHCRAVSNKITGRRHRAPRKFVVTDLPDQEEMFSTPTASPSKYAVSDGLAKAQGVQTVARRKAKMEVKGRFTIIDWSPDSPVLSSYRHDRGVDANSMKLESPRKRILRKQLSCNLRQSTGATPMPMQPGSRSMGSVSLAQERQQLTLKARPCAAPVAQPPANLNVFDNHLAFLEKESKDMKSTLEGMVNTNAQWIEMLAKSGLNLAPECAAVQANETEPVVAGEPAMSLASLRRPSFDDKYRNLELAYMELQKKYENVVHENERMEIKNIMLETRLQQQVTRAENLRGQLEKLTRYTENLIGDYSEPNYTGYTSDLNSLFGEQSSVEVDEQSPTAVEMGSDYEFNYEALKDHDHPPSPRRRRRSTDEECISDTSSEHEFSSGCEFGDNNRQFLGSSFAFDDRLHRPAGLTSADLSSPTRSATETAPRSVLVDPGALLAETKTNTSTSSDDDSMPPFPMFLNGHATRDDNQTIQEGGDRSDDHLRLGDLKRRSSSYMSMNMSTVSSTSSLASFGVQVAALSGSKDGSFSDLLSAAIARQRGEVSPPVSNQNDLENEPPSVLSKENLRVLERGGRRARTLQQAKLATAELEPQRDEPILSRGPEEDPFRVNC